MSHLETEGYQRRDLEQMQRELEARVAGGHVESALVVVGLMVRTVYEKLEAINRELKQIRKELD